MMNALAILSEQHTMQDSEHGVSDAARVHAIQLTLMKTGLMDGTGHETCTSRYCNVIDSRSPAICEIRLSKLCTHFLYAPLAQKIITKQTAYVTLMAVLALCRSIYHTVFALIE
jgi:hypothetical protein